MVLSDEAWTDLLGAAAGQMAGVELSRVKWIQERTAWLRVTAVFGWVGAMTEGLAKLCIGRIGG